MFAFSLWLSTVLGHILAINGDCTLGRTDLVVSTPRPIPGLYIDISTPASCSGFITRWNVCHYNPRFFSFADSLQIRLQVWRFDRALQNGILVGSNLATIRVPEVPTNFRCVPVEISQDQLINVTAGDFLGVVLANDVLPVVNNDRQLRNQPTLLHTLNMRTTITRERSGAVDLTSNAIHVTADIESPSTLLASTIAPMLSEGTSAPQQTESTSLSESTTRQKPATSTVYNVSSSTMEGTPPESSSSVPKFIGLIIGVSAGVIGVLLLLVAALTTGMVAVAARNRKVHHEELPSQGDVQNMTANQMYGLRCDIQMTENSAYGLQLSNSSLKMPNLPENEYEYITT